MPPYVGADAAGRTSVSPEPFRPADPGPGRPARRRAPVDALVAVIALVAFASVMTAVSDPQPGEPAAHAGHVGPVAADYLAIELAEAVRPAPRPGPAASTGSFSALCGRNEDGHRNSDNFITAPGRSNGAHHVHDYVGNTSTDGASTDESLAAAGTTCVGGNKSVYSGRCSGTSGTPALTPSGPAVVRTATSATSSPPTRSPSTSSAVRAYPSGRCRGSCGS